MSPDTYHPARLFYEDLDFRIVLTRCEELCELFASGEVNAAFVGGDYADEFGPLHARFVPIEILAVRFILAGPLGDLSDAPLKVYTKFPRVAARILPQVIEREFNIVRVSGGTEMYAAAGAGAAFDVECSGATTMRNSLSIHWRSHDITPGWLVDDLGMDFLKNKGIPDPVVIERLRRYCSSHIANRDDVTAATVLGI